MPDTFESEYYLNKIGILAAEKIRRLRNERLRDVRQSSEITFYAQQLYFFRHVWFGPKFYKDRQVLRTVNSSTLGFIGYMGLVHINRQASHCEFSSLLHSGVDEESKGYLEEFLFCISTAERICRSMSLGKIFAEVFRHREETINALFLAGFTEVERCDYPQEGRRLGQSFHSIFMVKSVSTIRPPPNP